MPHQFAAAPGRGGGCLQGQGVIVSSGLECDLFLASREDGQVGLIQGLSAAVIVCAPSAFRHHVTHQPELDLDNVEIRFREMPERYPSPVSFAKS